MTDTKIIKQNDLANVMEMNFAYSSSIEDLNNGISIGTTGTLKIKEIDTGGIIVDTPITVTAASAGVVTVLYEWQSGETTPSGRYRAECTLDLAGLPLTMPTVAYLNVLILPTL